MNIIWKLISKTVLKTEIINTRYRKHNFLQRICLGWKLMFNLEDLSKTWEDGMSGERPYAFQPFKTRSYRQCVSLSDVFPCFHSCYRVGSHPYTLQPKKIKWTLLTFSPNTGLTRMPPQRYSRSLGSVVTSSGLADSWLASFRSAHARGPSS